MSKPLNVTNSDDTTLGPPAVWLAAGVLLAGLGTVLLGPLLPTLAHQWRLSDQQLGVLPLTKFIGAFCGGVSVPRRLRFGILSGTLLACLGFGLFALSAGLATGAASLFVAGLGIGQIIASTNILAGRRYRSHTGSALSSLNFFFALGAVATGLIAAAVLPRFPLRDCLLAFAALFLATGLGGLLTSTQRLAEVSSDASRATTKLALPRAILWQFGLMLFLYGGLETCLTGWLTLFTVRFSDTHLLGGQSGLVLLWISLTAGRALASAALRRMQESTLQRIGLACAAALIAALALAHRGAFISLICILLGLALAPFFPTTFALLIKHRPSAREAGFILAVSGLGAALFTWLTGVVSTHSGSLRIGMVVPMLLALGLLALSFTAPAPSLETWNLEAPTAPTTPPA